MGQVSVQRDIDKKAIDRCFERWLSNRSAKTPPDREFIEESILMIYERNGLPAPAIFWCKSFYQLMAMPLILQRLLGSQSWSALSSELVFDFSVHSQAAGAPLANSVGAAAAPPNWNALWDRLWSSEQKSIMAEVHGRSDAEEAYGYLLPTLLDDTKTQLGRAVSQQRVPPIREPNIPNIYGYALPLPDTEPGVIRAHWTDLRQTCKELAEWLEKVDDEWTGWQHLHEESRLLQREQFRQAGVLSFLASRLGGIFNMPGSWAVWFLGSSNWLAEAEVLSHAFPFEFERHTPDLRLWLNVAQGCAAVLPSIGRVFLCEKPSKWELSDNGLLHHESEPALICSDGLIHYAWQGAIVDSRLIEHPETITVDEIRAEQNIEIRTVMIERYGLPRYIEESGIQPIHSDEYGTLYRTDLDDIESMFVVKVRNSTPEPDGTYRHYFLRVPPTMKTAREGIAWTFGMREDEYQPAVET